MKRKLKIEITDTFQDRWSGNYSWIEKHEIEIPFKLSQASVIRKIKKLIGWNGMRSDVVNYGDHYYVISPRNTCLVCFVNPIS
tara:strand:- start:561 stop:809 length:249 start_codon:yes stop_codon:yes gene_type:complete